LLKPGLKVKNRMVVRVPVVGPCDHLADWKVQVPLPSILREYGSTYHQPGKIPKFKIRSTISIECGSLLHHHKEKKIH